MANRQKQHPQGQTTASKEKRSTTGSASGPVRAQAQRNTRSSAASAAAAGQPVQPANNRKRNNSQTIVPPAKKKKADVALAATSLSKFKAKTANLTTRRKPAEIVSNDSDDADNENNVEGSPGPSQRNTNRRYDSEQDEEQDENKSDNESMADVDDDGPDSLAGLSKAELKQRFTSEIPRWNDRTSRRSGRQALDDDNDDDVAQTGVPSVTGDVDLTTASEFGGDLGGDDDDEDKAPIEESDGSDMDVRLKSASAKRNMARRSEVPQFKTSKPAVAGQSKGRVGRPRHQVSGEIFKDEDINANWPSEAHYMPILPNARMLSVTAQPLPMMKTLRAAIRAVSGDVIFDSAYPAVDSIAYSIYYRDVLYDCATKLGYKKLAARFKDDGDLLKLSAAILNARVSNIRTGCKDVASAKIEGFYLSRTRGTVATAELIKLLIEKTDYIYPTSEGGAIDTKQPFFHPAIISALKEYFFTGSRGSKADKHDNRFQSSLATGDAMNELELPIAMVSLVAAMIHASLDNWADGCYQKKGDFRAEAYEDVYNGHSMFLNDLKVEKPIFFHKLMSGLYNEVGSKKNKSAHTISRNNMARLNLADIDG